MKKKLTALFPFIILPIIIPVYIVIDSLILVKIFGCGCVPSTQTNMLNIPFNANDLRVAVFSLLTVCLTAWSAVISKAFDRKNGKILYSLGVFLFNAALTLWVVKSFMWA